MIAAVNNPPAIRLDDYPQLTAVDVICRDGVAGLVITNGLKDKAFPHWIIRTDRKADSLNDLGRCSNEAKSKLDIREIIGIRVQMLTP